MQKSGWEMIKPFIEQTVTAMFATQFEAEAKKKLPLLDTARYDTGSCASTETTVECASRYGGEACVLG